jgi:hypothetical protein
MSQSSFGSGPDYWKAGQQIPRSGVGAGTPAAPSQTAPRFLPPTQIATPAAQPPSTTSSQRPPLASDPETRADAQATLAAFNELGSLGPEYQDAVVDEFLARLDSRMAEQEESQPQPQVPLSPFSLQVQKQMYGKVPRYPVRMQPGKMPAMPSTAWTYGQTLGFIATVLGMAIPLTAIGAGMLGFVGFIIAWVGIAVVVGVAKGSGDSKNGKDK